MKLARMALFVLLTGTAGCSDDDDELLPAPLPECPQHDYRPCDARNGSCQQRMLSLAACIYGATDEPQVPVHVISENDFRAALEAGLLEEQESQTEEDLASTELLESALVDLRLVQVGALSGEATIDNYVESFIGIYQDAETGIILIDRGSPLNTPEADSTLIHEYIHALQDAEHDLDTWAEPYRDATDRLLAIRSVIEGEATFYGLRAGYAMLGYAADNTNWEGVFRNMRADMDARALEHPSPYIAGAATFPYAYGGLLAYRGWLDAGPGFAASLIEEPPLSTASVLQELFPADFDVDHREQDPAEPTATGDYALLDHEVLGSWLLRMLLVKFGLADTNARPLASTWAGDHLWLYRDPDDRRAWLWQLELDSEQAASSIAHLLEGLLPEGCVLEQAHRRLFVANGEGGPPRELLDAGSAFVGSPD